MFLRLLVLLAIVSLAGSASSRTSTMDLWYRALGGKSLVNQQLGRNHKFFGFNTSGTPGTLFRLIKNGPPDIKWDLASVIPECSSLMKFGASICTQDVEFRTGSSEFNVALGGGFIPLSASARSLLKTAETIYVETCWIDEALISGLWASSLKDLQSHGGPVTRYLEDARRPGTCVVYHSLVVKTLSMRLVFSEQGSRDVKAAFATGSLQLGPAYHAEFNATGELQVEVKQDVCPFGAVASLDYDLNLTRL